MADDYSAQQIISDEHDGLPDRHAGVAALFGGAERIEDGLGRDFAEDLRSYLGGRRAPVPVVGGAWEDESEPVPVTTAPAATPAARGITDLIVDSGAPPKCGGTLADLIVSVGGRPGK